MFAVEVCDLPVTGGSMFVVVAGLFVLVAGVIVTRWVRQSAGRLSVVVAPLVLLGALVLAPQVADPCATTTTTVAPTTTTTVAPTTTTLAPVVNSVGSTGPGGGTIFYVDMTRAVGSQYFEVACVGWQNNCDGTTVDPGIEWGCYGTPISGADGTAIGTGEQNTDEIMAGCPTAGIAARRADDYVNNTLNEWFLPSKDELNELCKWAYGDTVNPVCNDDGNGDFSLTHGGFSAGGYWSSSEYDDASAWYQGFNFGFQYDNYKSYPYYVRPVRSF
jgi:hypothetical protein